MDLSEKDIFDYFSWNNDLDGKILLYLGDWYEWVQFDADNGDWLALVEMCATECHPSSTF